MAKEKTTRKRMSSSTRRLLDSFAPSKWPQVVIDAREEWKHVIAPNGYDDEELLQFLIAAYDSGKWCFTHQEQAFITGQKQAFVQEVYEWWEGSPAAYSLCHSFSEYLRYKQGLKKWSLEKLMEEGLPDNNTLKKDALVRIGLEGVGVWEVWAAVNQLPTAPIRKQKEITIKRILKHLKENDVPYVKLPNSIPTGNLGMPVIASSRDLYSFLGWSKDGEEEIPDYYMHPRGLRVLEKLDRFKQVKNREEWVEMKNKAKGVR
jgi:hypothetical protein